MFDDGHGKAHGRSTLPSLQGHLLVTLLRGFANPQIPEAIPRQKGSGEVDGDATDLDDLMMICPRHHTCAHLPGRKVSPVGDGRCRIHRLM